MRPCPLRLLIFSRRWDMRETSRRGQLALWWTDELRWDQLPASTRAELGKVLRALLQCAATSGGQAEAGDDE
jgi:hypothetical protein